MSQLSLDLMSKAVTGDLVAYINERLRGRRVVASVSGGRDSAAASLYLTELGIEHERVFMNTGWESQITYDYLRGPLTDKLGPITEIRGDLDFVQLVEKKGLFPSRNRRFCTELLKVVPIQRWLALRMAARIDDSAPELVNVVGIRRAESPARSQMAEWEWSDELDLEVWRPLVTWTADDVAAIHGRHGLEPNPLYEMGASRVGCWPCVFERKKGIALVARIDPGRIDLIRELSMRLNEREAARAAAAGESFVPRSLFSYHGGDSVHHPITIDEAVEWANSPRGEWQPPGAGDGCMRWGLCDTAAEAG